MGMTSSPFSWIQTITEDSLCISVNLTLYPREALFRVCYLFTDRCYLFLALEENADIVRVQFARKKPESDLTTIAAEFSNELINQKVRLDIAAETKQIRELIVTQAFAEADFLADTASGMSYDTDPKGISK